MGASAASLRCCHMEPALVDLTLGGVPNTCGSKEIIVQLPSAWSPLWTSEDNVACGLPATAASTELPIEDSPWSSPKSIKHTTSQWKLSRLFTLDIQELEGLQTSKVQQDLDQPEARPAYHFRSGAVYTGQWVGNARHGFGIQTWLDGTRYEGEWVSNEPQGCGRITFSNSDVYTGQWRQGAFDGLGVYRASDGTAYFGSWSEDQREGHGLEITPDGVKYAGLFRTGCKAGPGLCTWPDGGQYCGDWEDDQISGLGVHRNARGGVFRGRWLAAARHGVGCHVWRDGRCYMGTYEDNSEVGFGCYLDQEGLQCTVGYWRDGTFRRQAPDATDFPLVPALHALALLQPTPTTPGSDEVVLTRERSWDELRARRSRSGSDASAEQKQRAGPGPCAAKVSWGNVDEFLYDI